MADSVSTAWSDMEENYPPPPPGNPFSSTKAVSVKTEDLPPPLYEEEEEAVFSSMNDKEAVQRLAVSTDTIILPPPPVPVKEKINRSIPMPTREVENVGVPVEANRNEDRTLPAVPPKTIQIKQDVNTHQERSLPPVPAIEAVSERPVSKDTLEELEAVDKALSPPTVQTPVIKQTIRMIPEIEEPQSVSVNIPEPERFVPTPAVTPPVISTKPDVISPPVMSKKPVVPKTSSLPTKSTPQPKTFTSSKTTSFGVSSGVKPVSNSFKTASVPTKTVPSTKSSSFAISSNSKPVSKSFKTKPVATKSFKTQNFGSKTVATTSKPKTELKPVKSANVKSYNTRFQIGSSKPLKEPNLSKPEPKVPKASVKKEEKLPAPSHVSSFTNRFQAGSSSSKALNNKKPMSSPPKIKQTNKAFGSKKSITSSGNSFKGMSAAATGSSRFKTQNSNAKQGQKAVLPKPKVVKSARTSNIKKTDKSSSQPSYVNSFTNRFEGSSGSSKNVKDKLPAPKNAFKSNKVEKKQRRPSHVGSVKNKFEKAGSSKNVRNNFSKAPVSKPKATSSFKTTQTKATEQPAHLNSFKNRYKSNVGSNRALKQAKPNYSTPAKSKDSFNNILAQKVQNKKPGGGKYAPSNNSWQRSANMNKKGTVKERMSKLAAAGGNSSVRGIAKAGSAAASRVNASKTVTSNQYVKNIADKKL